MTGFPAVPAAAAAAESQDDDRRWAGVARVLGPPWARLPSLTVGLFGVQMTWSVEMSYASPYLLSLGLSKPLMAIVFLAGPLSGLIVQPMIGILADNSKSRFGRRRPFIAVAAVLCAIATLLLGFTRPSAAVFTTPDSHSNDILTIWLAVLSIYCIDFSINAVQALDRALLVDIIPTAKQPAGNAWAARMLAIGSVAGFFVGNLDLPLLFPFFGSVQLEALSVVAAILLLVTQAWVCFHVKERVLLSSSVPKGLGQGLKEIWKTFVTLPSVIRQICWIQFFAWMGWFPVLFYTTVYVGDLHKRASPVPESKNALIALDAESTRLGTRALFYSASVSLVTNILVPFLVVPLRAGHAASPLQSKQKTWLKGFRMHLASMWALSHFIFAACMAATFVTSTVSGATLIVSVSGFCWAITQWAPFALLGEAILSHSASDDAALIHLADARSARMVPLRGDVEHNANDEEIQRLFDAGADDDDNLPDDHFYSHSPVEVQNSSVSILDAGDERDPHLRVNGLGNARTRISRIDVSACSPHLEGNEVTQSTPGSTSRLSHSLSAQAGAILGIHNVFVVIPQFLVTGLSSVVFAIVDPDKSAVLHGHPPGNTSMDDQTIRDAAKQSGSVDATVMIFRLGGIAAAMAFVMSYRLARQRR